MARNSLIEMTSPGLGLIGVSLIMIGSKMRSLVQEVTRPQKLQTIRKDGITFFIFSLLPEFSSRIHYLMCEQKGGKVHRQHLEAWIEKESDLFQIKFCSV